ncbi:2OG-Fe(II) oxygenase, putative [Bodo saltans]|uniref:2OG-Fe(II) oxygenase, putative n=1 Tax=Bodo saltans TaxID=75058 RepID=A0A0S4JCJ0_BODSA|nr:2OG-Fe(II) oxygenase, putative [Bodo saltans]|eukprot:CUG87917.1 2OG-Fe(II) oxygenase, putative [Bodo saltans]
MRRITVIRLSSRGARRHGSGASQSEHFVSFQAAPGFSQAPKSTIGKAPKDVPETTVQCYVIPEVVTAEEERALIDFTSPWFDRLPYGDGHVDGLIHHYKEFYRPFTGLMTDDSYFEETASARKMVAASSNTSSSPSGRTIEGRSSLLQESVEESRMQCVRSALAMCRRISTEHLPFIPVQERVHFLQLHGDGFIRAHTDESRNSSGIVAGLTLGSGRVMSLTHKRFPGKRIDLLLAPRSFYVLCGAARHEWEHSVDWTVDDDEHLQRAMKSHVAEGSPVLFEGKPTGFTRGMRTAVIFRGLSPMDLLMQRMKEKEAAAAALSR